MQGLNQFWQASDGVGRAVAVLLLVMSVSAWVLILWKGWVLRRAAGDIARAVPAKSTVWSPTMSPPRTVAKPIAPGGRSPVWPWRLSTPCVARSTPRAAASTSPMASAVPAFWDAASLDDGRSRLAALDRERVLLPLLDLSLIHISEPTRPY